MFRSTSTYTTYADATFANGLGSDNLWSDDEVDDIVHRVLAVEAEMVKKQELLNGFYKDEEEEYVFADLFILPSNEVKVELKVVQPAYDHDPLNDSFSSWSTFDLDEDDLEVKEKVTKIKSRADIRKPLEAIKSHKSYHHPHHLRIRPFTTEQKKGFLVKDKKISVNRKFDRMCKAKSH